MNLYNFGFLDESKKTFLWCKKLLQDIPVKILLPASLICKSCLIDSILRDESGLNVAVSNMNINQLQNEPGFNAHGSFHLGLPVWLPPILLNIGFLQLDMWGVGRPLAAVRLTQGITYDMRNPYSDFLLDLIFKDGISPQIQELCDAILLERHTSATVGIGGIVMGKDSSHHIVTFSKIFVDMNFEDLRSKLFAAFDHFLPTLLKPNLFRLQGFNLHVKSSKLITTGFEADFFNPTNFGLDIGSVRFSVQSAGEYLGRLDVPPLSLKPGTQGLNISVDASMGGVQSNALSSIVEAITHQTQHSGDFPGFELKDLQIFPKDSRNGQGIIDMLYGVTVTISPSFIHKTIMQIIQNIGSADSIVDVSALIPSENEISLMMPVAKALSLKALPNTTLSAGIIAEYVNPLAISIRVPYFEVTVSLGGLDKEMMTFGLSGLEINRGRGLIKMDSFIKFKSFDSELAANFGLLYSNFLNGTINPAIGIKKISFGLNSNDKNQILENIELDLTFLTDHLGWIGPHFANYIEEFVMKFIDANSINIRSAMEKRSLIVGVGNSSLISFDDIDVGFGQSKEVFVSILAKIIIPFDIEVSLPFIRTFISIDDDPFVNIDIEGIVINNKFKFRDSLSLKTVLKFYDSDALADRFGEISKLIHNNKRSMSSLHLSRFELGENSQDLIRIFSEIRLPVPLESIWEIALRLIYQFKDANSLDQIIESFGLQIHGVSALTLPNRSIRCGADVAFNLVNMSISDLGYFYSDVSLTGTPFLSIISPGISLSPGRNTMNFSSNIQFPSSEDIQEKIALLASDLSSGTLELVNDSYFGLSEFRFGTSESDSIKFLRKVKIDIPAKLLLNPTILKFGIATVKKLLNSDLTHLIENVLQRLILNSMSLDALESSYISVNGSVGVRDIPASIDMKMGHFVVLATFNEERYVLVRLIT